MEADHGDGGHALETPRHRDFELTRGDPRRDPGDGLEARGAEPVDRVRRYLGGESREETDDPSDVQPLLAFGHRAPEGEVLHRGPRDLRALQRGTHRGGCEVFGTGLPKAPFVGATERRARPFDNDDFLHGQFLSGLLFMSMCWIRSSVFGSPHKERNASRSSS